MSDEKQIKRSLTLTRRAFLKYAGAAGIAFPTVIGMVPNMLSGRLGWRAYAQSEGKIPDGLLEIARKYGQPQGKFGKIGEPVALTIGYQPYCTPYWTSTVNKQANIWAKHLPKGSRVIWFRALSGPDINKNMSQGKNQFGYMAETPGLSSGDTVDCDMVSATGYDLGETGAFCIRKDLVQGGKIKTAEDVVGQTMATPFGSFSHRQALTWAYENGVKTNFSNESIDQQFTDLKENKIGAAITWEPYPSFMEERGLAVRWLTGQDMPCTCHKYFPEAAAHPFSVVGSTLAIFEWMRDRPDVMMAYLKSEEECRDMLTNDPDLAAFHIMNDIGGTSIKSDIIDIKPAVVRSTLDMMVWDGRITPECRKHLKGVARMWKDINKLSGKRSANPDQFVDSWADDRMLRLAMADLKARGQWNSDRLPGFPNPARPDQTKRHDSKKYQGIKLQEKEWKPTKA